MPISQTPSLSEVKNLFGGDGKLSSYRKGGGLVPDIPANAAISTTVSGLALSQFKGADNVTVTITPSGSILSNDSKLQGASFGAWAGVRFSNTGTVSNMNSKVAETVRSNWMTGGTTADANNYEAYCEANSGSSTTALAQGATYVNVWTSLGGGLYFGTKTADSEGQLFSFSAKITIRRKGTTAILGTWNMTLSASGGGPV